jgi:predicted Zn-dependent protease
MNRLHLILIRFIIFAVAILLIPSCAVNPVTGKKQLVLISESQEIAMGAQYDPEIIATYGEYNSPELLKLITEKGEAIGKLSHRPNLQYKFRILDSPVVNAFAVPGGYIYITRGILAQFNNEAEMMGVIGHEIGHVTARHSVQQMTQQQLAQIGLAVGVSVSKDFAKFAGVASQGVELLFLKFSRDHEKQSDKLGVEYATKMGYDTHKMADFFQVLQKMQVSEGPSGIPTFLSTHPDPGDRYNAVNKMTTEWQDSLKTGNWKVNGDSYLKLLDGLVYGEDPRQGYVEASTFYHPELKFQFPFPSGWKLANTPNQVQMSPSDGAALIIFSMSDKKNLDSASVAALQSLNLTALTSTRISVNGMPALVVTSEQVNKDATTGQVTSALKVLSYFIDYNSTIYIFHGVTDAAKYDTYLSAFEATMSKFAKLTDPKKINVQPQRIKIMAATKTGTLSETLTGFGVAKEKLAEVALLNEMELTAQVAKGKLVKVVR